MNTLKVFKPALVSHSKLYLNTTIKRSLFHTSSILKQYENNSPPHLDTLAYLTPEQINNLVKKALEMKYQVKVENKEFTHLLKGQTVAMLFTKRSTRTRVATESAVTLLGAKPMYLASSDIQLGVNESLFDTTKVLSSMVSCIVARVNEHETIEQLIEHSQVPVINALSDLYHPTQILADIMTLHEHYSLKQNPTKSPHETNPLDTLKGLKVSWIGDCNNVWCSLLLNLPKFGIEFTTANPKGYEPIPQMVELSEKLTPHKINWNTFNDPLKAIKGSDVLITDTWISMGQEEEKAKRLKDFEGYQITEEMAQKGEAKSDWIFMHCLPRKQEEVNDEVFYSPRSLVFEEAENRKWTILSTLHTLLVDKKF